MRSRVTAGVWLWALAVAGCGARSEVTCFGSECRGTVEPVGPGSRDPSSAAGSSSVGGASGSGFEPGASGSGFGPGAPGPGFPMGGTASISEPPPPVLDIVTRQGGQCDPVLGPGELVISTAAELAELEGCVVIDADLTLESFVVPDLSALSSLEVVTGSLTIRTSGALTGLGALRKVRSLHLLGIDAPALLPLRALGVLDRGILEISGAQRLTSLNGLSGIVNARVVTIENNFELESLGGLELTQDETQLALRNNPNLTDLSGALGAGVFRRIEIRRSPGVVSLGQVRHIEEIRTLHLEGVGVETLDELDGLVVLGSLTLRDNPRLSNIDAVAAVEALSSLSVIRNAALDHLPVFSLATRVGGVAIRDNQALRTGPSFPAVANAGSVSIVDNPSLERLDGFAALRDVARLEVRGNAALTLLDLSSLEGFRSIAVTCNPNLPENSLAPLRELTGQLELSGNLGSPEPCR